MSWWMFYLITFKNETYLTVKQRIKKSIKIPYIVKKRYSTRECNLSERKYSFELNSYLNMPHSFSKIWDLKKFSSLIQFYLHLIASKLSSILLWDIERKKEKLMKFLQRKSSAHLSQNLHLFIAFLPPSDVILFLHLFFAFILYKNNNKYQQRYVIFIHIYDSQKYNPYGTLIYVNMRKKCHVLINIKEIIHLMYVCNKYHGQIFFLQWT